MSKFQHELEVKREMEGCVHFRGTASADQTQALECSECPWRGYEDDAIRRDEPVEDWWYECPSCSAVCAHLPMDEWDPAPKNDRSANQTSAEAKTK